MILIAKEFGVLPQEVEQMDAWWFDRIVEYMSGRTIYEEAEEAKRRKSKRK